MVLCTYMDITNGAPFVVYIYGHNKWRSEVLCTYMDITNGAPFVSNGAPFAQHSVVWEPTQSDFCVRARARARARVCCAHARACAYARARACACGRRDIGLPYLIIHIPKP